MLPATHILHISYGQVCIYKYIHTLTPLFSKNQNKQSPWKGYVADRADFFKRVVPICLHGDAVAVTNRLSLDIVSWSSCLPTTLPTKEAKMYITGVLNKSVVEQTAREMWAVVVWALMPLLSGVHPMRNHNGNPFMDYRDELGRRRVRLCGDLVSRAENNM